MKEYLYDNAERCDTEGTAISWIPHVIEEGYNGTREVNLQTKHFSNRKIFLTGEVTEQMANNFVSEFLYLAQSNEPIDIYLNSPGGSVVDGLVIYDLIQSAEGKIPINIYCAGTAYSMGAIILAGGQKGRRFILPHSKCMIHEPLIPNGARGSASSIKKTADSILETRDILNGILEKHTGKSRKEVNKATSYDNYMTAREAVDFGLCDEIRDLV